MASLLKKKISGRSYFYLDKNIKLGEGRWKKVSVYFGPKNPSKKELANAKKKLEKRAKTAVSDFYAKRLENFAFSILSKEQLSEVERLRDNFQKRFKRLDAKKKEKFNKRQIINFVYTTLRTEGIDVEMSDVETAYAELGKKNPEMTMDEKLIISSSMITGFNFLPKIKMTLEGILKLHGIVMSTFESDSPGQIRDDQRIIARTNPKTLQREEIGYRPPEPGQIRPELEKFFVWLGENKNIHPLELSALVHLKVYRIHPFKDGNKRMSRLLFNKVLLDADYPILNISKETKEYFKALVESVETKNDNPFVIFCYKTFIRQTKNRFL
ncbi:MAG TPA: Fic family protein [archaeon]|nr:Fic family protein [archaeon]